MIMQNHNVYLSSSYTQNTNHILKHCWSYNGVADIKKEFWMLFLFKLESIFPPPYTVENLIIDYWSEEITV